MVRRTILPNGLTILTEQTPHHRGAVALFRYNAGSSREVRSEWGTAHFLEHMVFQGTADKNHDRFMMDLGRLGAAANASTGFESTVYEVTAPAETILQAIALAAEMIEGFILDPVKIDRERDIILEEWRMTRDDPAAWGEDCLYQQVLGEFGHPILGTEDSLPDINRERLRNFADQYYTPGNLIVSVAGNVEHDRIVEILQRRFGNDHRQTAFPRTIEMSQSKRLHIDEDQEQEHIFLGFQAPTLVDSLLPAFDVLSLILGGESWSRLFRKIRNERGLAYSVGGFYSGWKEAGLYGIQSAAHPDNSKELLDAIYQEIRLIQKDLTADEVELAKTTLQANLLFGTDQLGWRAERLLTDEAVFGRIRTVEEDLNMIRNVTIEQALALANTILKLENASLVTVGNIEL